MVATFPACHREARRVAGRHARRRFRGRGADLPRDVPWVAAPGAWGFSVNPFVKSLRSLLAAAGLRFRPNDGAVAVSSAALASFPHPILLADGENRLSPLNGAAKSLDPATESGLVSELLPLLSRAALSGGALCEQVAFDGPAGTLFFDVTILPISEPAALVIAKDVTLESNLRTALVESRGRYKDLVEISTDFAWEIGEDGGFGFVSPRGALGFAAHEMVGRKPEEFLAEESGADGLLPFHSPHCVEKAEVWMRRAEGGAACLRVSSAPMLDADGRRRGMRGIWQDVTAEREREMALAKADNRERLLTYVVRAIRDVVEPDDMLRTAAEATSLALGGAGSQVFRRRDGAFEPAGSFGDVGGAGAVLAALRDTDVVDLAIGDFRALAAVSRYRQQVNGAIVIWRSAEVVPWDRDDRLLLEDVADQIGIANEQIANHERILALSRTDALTGLFNRRAFFEELGRRFARLSHEEKPASLIYIDLDNFKAVNDQHGHKRGDEALMAVRDILNRHTRPFDLIARLGGDEFALWLDGADETIAVRRCQEIAEAAQALMAFSGSDQAPLTLSMGVAVYRPGRLETLDDLLQRADEAMYSVKHDGKCDFRVARPAGSGAEAS